MNDEIEATFKNVNKDKVRSILKSSGAKLVKPEFLQKRTSFNLPVLEFSPTEIPTVKAINGSNYIIFDENKRLKVSNADKATQIIETILSSDIRSQENKGWMRIRDEQDRITLTYKREDASQIDGMREIEVIIDDYDKASALLNYLGCENKAYQETKRELWELNDVEITIDEWPYLDPFVEVEGRSEEAVREVSDLLGFKWETAHFGAVDALYAEKFRVTKKQINDETPEIVFDKPNPFLNRN